MSKIRIRELAKELGVESKKVIDALESRGISGKTAASGLEDREAAEVRHHFGKNQDAGSQAGTASGAPSSGETAKAGQMKKEGTQGTDAAKNPQAGAAEKPKKKRVIAVFHPQNASSREGKNFGHGNGQKNRDNGRRNPVGRPGTAHDPRHGRAEENRGGRPAGNAPAAKTPLVHVPRPHGVIRNENPKPPVSNVPEKKPQMSNVPEKKPQMPAEEAVKDEIRTTAAAPVENVTARPAEEPKVSPVTPVQEKPAAAEQKPAETAEKTAGTKDVRPQETARQEFQGRPAAENTASVQKTENHGQARPQTDRNRRNGQDRFSGRNTGDRNGQDRGRKPFADRNGRTGQSAQPGRPAFGNRRGGAPFGRQEGAGTGGRPGMHQGRPGAHGERHAGGAAPAETGLRKPGRDARNHDKDKAKEDLRGNKFTNDSRKGQHGHDNRKLIPKALQKPVHKKDEKKEDKVTEIRVPDKLTIRELAERMKMNPSVIVKDLFLKGEMYTVNQEVDYDKAEEIAMNYDILCDHEETVDVIAEMLKEDEEDESKLVPRPPVVCVMGHVDHGKTSLLDRIRHSHVTQREAGGITQNIGAYCVTINGRKITFLDTPGHEAFTAMRMRGANSTDIAVLVVAADDGVMPQTIEAINHAKAADVEIIVAINKIDKPGANPDRVKQELTEYGLVASDWGGQTEMVEVSAKTGQGIDDLLETILLTADILELKANPDRLARGLVLEARLDKGRGPVANLLVQKGTLHIGDYIACGSAYGKVRAMTDENGRQVKAAGPSTPVGVQGLNGVPDAGEVLLATETDKEAKQIAATYVNERKHQLLEETKSRMSLDALFDQIRDGSVKELELIVKADVQGSVEALKQALEKLSNDEVVIKIIHGGVGAITESDISLAAASNAIVIGFNVRPDQTAKALADEQKVDVRLYRVIYQAIDDITAAMNGMLEPVYEEKVIGHAEVRQIFKASGVGAIAGSYVLDGSIRRGCKVRVQRGEDQIFEGNLSSLKRFKDDAKEVKAGYECGIVVDGFDGFEEGDRIEASIMEEVPR